MHCGGSLGGGSDLTKPMEMDFFVAATSEDAGNAVAGQAQRIGLSTKVVQDEESSDWTCDCTKTIIARYETVVKIEHALDAIARPFGGHLDRFGSYGTAG